MVCNLRMIFIHFNDWGKINQRNGILKHVTVTWHWNFSFCKWNFTVMQPHLFAYTFGGMLSYCKGTVAATETTWPTRPNTWAIWLVGKKFIMTWKLRAAIIHVFSRQQLETLLDIYWLYLLHQLCSTHTAFQQLLADYCSLEIIAFTGKEIPTYLVSICYFHNNVFWPVLKDLKGSFLRWLLDVFTEQKFLGHILLCRLYSRLFIS